MGSRLFTLIYGDRIRVAPKNKIIPAESFSKLVEADEVLDLIKKDAEHYREEVIKECEQLKESAEKEGYEAGFQQWTEHLLKLEDEIEQVHQELQKMIIPLALRAAKKIVGREIELSETVIVDIVAATLKTVAQHKKIAVYVNRKELEVVEQHKPKLKEIFESLESLSIRPRDDIAPGGCIIETEVGIINAQMDHRWHILEKAFESLMKTPESSSSH